MDPSVKPPETGNRRTAAKAATRAKVIEAAKHQFAIHGFTAADVRSIALGAAMSTGAIFNSFRSKAELYTAATGRQPPTPLTADASPEMLDALKATELFVDSLQQGGLLPATIPALDQVRAAIALAEGRDDDALTTWTGPSEDERQALTKLVAQFFRDRGWYDVVAHDNPRDLAGAILARLRSPAPERRPKDKVAKARDQVIEQACEAVAGPGAPDALRHAVLAYYEACSDDEMAADLRQELGLPAPPTASTQEG